MRHDAGEEGSIGMENVEVRIVCAEDCGNAPKKIVIRDCLTALARGDRDKLRDFFAADAVCDLVGVGEFRGIEEALGRIGAAAEAEMWLEVRIDNIITHGNVGAANGIIRTAGRNIAFCDVYRFASAGNAKIKRITAYRIPLEGTRSGTAAAGREM